ncbi:MAG: hypothetical protein ABI041_16395, partial [Bdellovibrionia bacterium]
MLNISSEEFITLLPGPHLEILSTDQPQDPQKAFNPPLKPIITKDQEVPAFGYTHTQYVARLFLENTSSKTIQVYFVFFGPIENIYLQNYKDGMLESFDKTGMFVSLRSSDTDKMFRYPYFKIDLTPGKHTFYLGESAVAPHFPIRIMSGTNFNNFVVSQDMEVSGFFALNSFILIISILMAFALRDRLSILYALSILTTFLFNIFVTGGFRPLLYL